MIHAHDISGCLAERIGAGGLDADEFAAARARAGEAAAGVARWHRDGSLALLKVPARRDDLAAAREAAAFLRDGSSDIAVLGTGGSSLGAQALTQLAGYRVAGAADPGGRRLHFLDNLDAGALAAAWETLPLATTRLLIVSKSGGTPETVVQAATALDALARHGLEPGRHLAVITEPGSPSRNALLRLTEPYRPLTLDHDPGVGGRFSVLTNVGLVPALAVGLDAEAIRDGAAASLADTLTGGGMAADGAAVCVGLTERRGLNAVVLMPYAERLRLTSAWFAQLWAESLGKGGRGTQPVAAAGPVDQHSQMQLFLDGPRDKLLTLVTTASAGTGSRLADRFAGDPLLGYLAGRTVGDVTDCQQRAAAEVLVRNGRPVRSLSLGRVDERAVGGLLMHFMLETILAGLMTGVDPFDQPAVEQGKVLTREYLERM